MYTQAERYFDARYGALFDVLGFDDRNFGELLLVHTADQGQVAFVTRLLGRNMNILLHRDYRTQVERSMFLRFCLVTSFGRAGSLAPVRCGYR
jgi:hypothetical protein